MRVFKPQHLSVMYRPFERQRQAFLCVTVVGFIPLQDKPELLSEQQLWETIPDLLEDYPLDVCVPKTGAEFLVAGNACTPDAQPLAGLKVGAKIGKLQKLLHVFGDRQWAGASATDPVPFQAMPVSWANTFGGSDFADNPVGIGHRSAAQGKGVVHKLPNVEYPQSPSMSPGKHLPPASFGPIPQTWPARTRFDGTYDDRWLNQDFPGPPKDMNWRYYCVASEDQWQPEAFRGDEAVELVHMHPAHARISAKLPGIRPVIAVRREDMAPNSARFLDAELDTVWLFPNQLKAALIWHALMPIADEFANQIELLMVGADWIDRPRQHEHFLQAISARLDDEQGAIRMLDDSDLLPEGIGTPNAMVERYESLLGSSGVALENVQANVRRGQELLNEQLTQRFGPQASAMLDAQRKTQLLALGLPDLSAGIPTKPADLLKFALNPQNKPPQAQALNAVLQAEKAVKIERTRQSLAGQPAALAGLDAILAGKPAMPAKSPGPAALARLQESIATLPGHVESDTAKAFGLDPKIKALAAQTIPSSNALAHFQDPPARLSESQTKKWRDGAQKAKSLGKSFAGKQLQGADFSNMDLSGVDFSGAQLDGVDFTGARLDAADFSNASLAHAVLVRASLDAASFAGANLGKARLNEAIATKCNFAAATLTETRFDSADLSGSTFASATLMQTRIRAAQLRGVVMADAIVLRCKLAGSCFAGADLSKSSFVECLLEGADFNAATLTGVDFVTCSMDGVILDCARADNVRFVHGTTLNRASFRAASLARSSFRGIKLHAADFGKAVLDGADFGRAQCTDANFSYASCKGVLFMQADLIGANMAFANLMQAILQHTRLQATNLFGANLFAVDLARVEMDERTRFDTSFMAKVRTLPKHKVATPSGQEAARK